ncbi:hypothetical protein ACS0TY_004061 [Phlomoides rotata]
MIHMFYTWKFSRLIHRSLNRLVSPPRIIGDVPSLFHSRIQIAILMENRRDFTAESPASAHSNRSGGRGRGLEMKDNYPRSRGSGGGSAGKDKIDALGRLLTRILRHMASVLKLDMRSDGFVKVQDLLMLNLKNFANVPLRSHTIEDVREAVRKDNKQRFSLLEENGELLIRANQGHTLTTVETESLLKPILSHEEVPVCVHGTYKKNLESILQYGLKRMKRLHVHFSCGLPTDGEVISGKISDSVNTYSRSIIHGLLLMSQTRFSCTLHADLL